MLAIVIPYFKKFFFEETLISLANQTDKRFVVYIGDDASKESPKDLLEKMKGKFEFYYHKFDENLGSKSLTQQWDRCIMLTKNEPWLMVLGDDDLLGSNVVSSFYENLAEIFSTNFKVIRFSVIKINDLSENISTLFINPKKEKAIDLLFEKKRCSLSEHIFWKENVINIGFKNFELGWFSDVLAVLEFSNFEDVFSINEAQISIRISENSISGMKLNFKKKATATKQFYSYLLINKKEYFDKNERIELLNRLSNCYLNNKKNVVFFLMISIIYIQNLHFVEYFKFCSKTLKSILKIKQ